MNRKAWPDIVALEYERIVMGCDRLVRLGYLLRNRAVFGVANTKLLESLLGLMPGELVEVRHYCLMANDKRGYYVGRFPRWVVAALEDAYKQGNWCLVEEMVCLVHEDLLRLQRFFQVGPPPPVRGDDVEVVEVEVLMNGGWERVV